MKSEPKPKSATALPLKPVGEELAFLRTSFRELITAYSAKIESDIAGLQQAITAATESRRKFPASRVAELRDMLMLLRNFDIKPVKGKRRDLKKVETLVADLKDIVDRWGV